MKPAFAAVQSIFQLFDEDVEPVPDALFSFDCERKPSNATPPACPASAHATPPQAGMHCNLKNTTHLGGAAKAKDAAECQSMCCGTPRCSCWAFSKGGSNEGCWLQDSPVPLQPTSDKNVCGGKVTPHTGPSSGHAVEGFEPVGHAFRNRSAAPDGITHVVVWDASPGCNGAVCDTIRENDRLTRCSVRVTTGAFDEREGVDESPALTVMLSNGTVHEMPESAARFRGGAVELDIHLYDAPLLVVQSDAMPPIERHAGPRDAHKLKSDGGWLA